VLVQRAHGVNHEVCTVVWPDGSYTHLPIGLFALDPAAHSLAIAASGLLWVTTTQEAEMCAYAWTDIERLRGRG
jgi:hypothetical protein